MNRLLVLLALCWAGSSYAMTADAYLVEDLNGTVLMEKNADEVRSIASITKLFIAQASEKMDQNEQITITHEDLKAGHMRSTPLRVGQSYSRKDLTELALVSSDNVAAIALGRSVPYNTTQLAILVEASGLNPANRSTARQLADLAKELYNTELAATSTHKFAEIGNRHSTNPLLEHDGWTFYLSKTGFINEAGGCLVTITEMQGRIVIAVVLGAANTRERWNDLIELRRHLGDTDFYVPPTVRVAAKKPHRKHKG